MRLFILISIIYVRAHTVGVRGVQLRRYGGAAAAAIDENSGVATEIAHLLLA